MKLYEIFNRKEAFAAAKTSDQAESLTERYIL